MEASDGGAGLGLGSLPRGGVTISGGSSASFGKLSRGSFGGLFGGLLDTSRGVYCDEDSEGDMGTASPGLTARTLTLATPSTGAGLRCWDGAGEVLSIGWGDLSGLASLGLDILAALDLAS